MQTLCTLRDIKSFLGVFPSYLVPNSITRSVTFIINTDPHTEKVSHWLATHFESRVFSAYYFDSFVFSPIIPALRAFLRRNCTVWDYNSVQLLGLISTVCGQYCCRFALYMDKGYTPKQFVGLFNADLVDRQINKSFSSEFGSLRENSRGGQCGYSNYKS